MHWILSLVLGFACGAHAQVNRTLIHPDHWLAIVGDSGVTGAASNPNLAPTFPKLFSLLYNFVTEEPWPASPDPLTRVFYSHREYEDANLKSLLKAQMDLFARLDVPENSFGYKVGRDL